MALDIQKLLDISSRDLDFFKISDVYIHVHVRTSLDSKKSLLDV